jgi:hypothetical protein
MTPLPTPIIRDDRPQHTRLRHVRSAMYVPHGRAQWLDCTLRRRAHP